MTVKIDAGLYPRNRALPQLLLDFSFPETYLEVFLKVTDPAARRPVLFPLVPNALCWQTRDPVKLEQQRVKMMYDMENIERVLVFEAHCLCGCRTSLTRFRKRG